jgi:hypothetical protein
VFVALCYSGCLRQLSPMRVKALKPIFSSQSLPHSNLLHCGPTTLVIKLRRYSCKSRFNVDSLGCNRLIWDGGYLRARFLFKCDAVDCCTEEQVSE